MVYPARGARAKDAGKIDMPVLPIWIKPLGIVLLIAGVFIAGWHERGIISDAELSTYKASVAQAQSTQAIQSAHEQVASAQATVKSEQSHVQAITSLNAYWTSILRQRTTNSSGKLPKVSSAPRSVDAIPTQCIPLAASTAQDIQQLVDLQAWIKSQQAISQAN